MNESEVRYLLVEDDDRHAKLLSRCLAEATGNPRIDRVRDGEEALGYLRRSKGAPIDERPRVILLDLKIPKISGLEVLAEIRRDPDLRTLPVVVLTTSSDPEDVRAAYDGAVNSYLIKPLDFSEFRSLAASIGEYWGSWNESPHT